MILYVTDQGAGVYRRGERLQVRRRKVDVGTVAHRLRRSIQQVGQVTNAESLRGIIGEEGQYRAFLVR